MKSSQSQNEATGKTGTEMPEIIIDYASDKENDGLNVDNHRLKEKDEPCFDSERKKPEDDKIVTLRRQNISLDNLSTFTEDDYNFSNFVLDSHSFRSRKKTEIGSEKMISNDVSNTSID